MKSKTQHFFYLFFFIALKLFCQELPPVQNFSPRDYNAENQNWSITQGEDKSIYVANNKGLLEYNGAKWNLYKSPNETIIRSVNAIKDKIYTGCYMEFGFWEKDSIGKLRYKSLSQKISDKIIEDEQFWNIVEIENWILFQSLNSIYMYNTDSDNFSIIRSNETIVKMYNTSKGIYFQRSNIGLFKIENGKELLLTDDDIAKKNRIINVFEDNDGLQILTQNNGFYALKNGKLKNSFTEINQKLSTISIYNSIQLKDGSFIAGSISNGVYHFNNNGEIIYHIDQHSGLQDNTVLSVFEDKESNIWLGLDNGISLVNQNSPLKIFNDLEGTLGSIYTTSIYNDKLYLGTNQGLFFKKLNTNDEFSFVDGTQGQVWSLKVHDGVLFCGHDLGTFTIQENSLNKISNIQGAWNFKTVENSGLLLQGNYSGLYVLEKYRSVWRVRNKIKGFNISSRYFEILKNDIFINHEYQGVIKLAVNEGFTNIKETVRVPVNKGLNSSLVKFNENLFYAYKEGVFKYNTNKEIFEKDSLLSGIYKDKFTSGKLVVNNSAKEMWAFTKSNIYQIIPSKLSEVLKINKIPLANDVRKSVTGYEDILKMNATQYLLASASGYMIIDISKLEDYEFKVAINEIVNVYSNQNNAPKFLNLSEDLTKLNSTENTIKFSYNLPKFTKYFETKYQYRLLGSNHEEWSEWSSASEKLYENLAYGDYTFYVRAKVGNTISSNVATFSFNINKPWYVSNVAIVVYILGVLLFSLFMHNVYRNYYKKQQRKLIVQNQKEIQLVQVKNEKEIIRIKNEKLNQDFKEKSKELATSIMSIVRKNELLNNIKEKLSRSTSSKDIESIVKLIDKSLKQTDDWEFFQEAFNNADREFLKKLKTLHPKLSPNDLKLCAYLRLNLSSKEIAPLFNISTRSLEIKRYRLRKKMNLSSKENLANYILEL